MDPHSRLQQFNARQTKVGPLPSPRSPETLFKTAPTLEGYKKAPTPSKKDSSANNMSIVSRPTVTNSRIKKDEQYRKDMYLALINNALQQKERGISDSFDELVDQFSPKQHATSPTSSSAQLRLWLVALSHVVSRLERTHSALVEAVVGMSWTTMDSSFVKTYTSFVGMLVSARPEYLTIVLTKIAHGLTYQSGLQALDAGIPESSSSPLTRRAVYERIHYLLQHLISLIPTLPSALSPLLVRNFPHKRQSQAAQVTFIRNLLRITQYCPELSDRILATIVDRAVQIDVEIQVELEEIEEQAAQGDHAEVFDLDPFDTLVGQDEVAHDSDDESDDEGDNFSDLSSEAGGDDDSSSSESEEEPTKLQHVQDMVNKLDAILKNVFDHFKDAEASPSIPSSMSSSSGESVPLTPIDTRPQSPTEDPERVQAQRRAQFFTLLSIFDRIILRTFKSRYTQFLVFWYASLDPEFTDLFQGMLVSKALLEEDQPSVTRAAAASYIASFVSRALFVDRANARQVVACLCNFLKSRLDIFDALIQSGAPTPSMAHHSIFYAVAQAVFLIFCFRWRDLSQDEEDLDELALPAQAIRSKWMPELEILKQVIQSDLNPLKVCSANVVMQFARVAHATDFIYCYSIIESNRRSEYAPTSTGSGQTGSSRQHNSAIHPALLGHSMHSELNTFFPFDPYKLPRSSSYIDEIYRDWSSVAIDEEEDEEDEENEVEESVHEHGSFSSIPVNNAHASSEDQETDGLGASFGGMSISPAQPSVQIPLTLSTSLAMSIS